MSLPKPTILLIPGAWHRGSTFEPVAALLRTQGYPVKILTLLSVGGPTSTTVADDAAYIQRNLISQGKEVVVVMHSYGTIPSVPTI
jgi:pimeloyl-ACP methyl ester carboxylesterase